MPTQSAVSSSGSESSVQIRGRSCFPRPQPCCHEAHARQGQRCRLRHRRRHEPVKHPIGIGVEPGDLARVGDARYLCDFHAVIELLGRIVQERVLSGERVVEEAVLLVVESP